MEDPSETLATSTLFISLANWKLPDNVPGSLTESLRDGAIVRILWDRLPWWSYSSLVFVDNRCMLRESQVISAASAREKQLNSAIRWRRIRPQSTATGPLATLMTSAGRVQSAHTTYPTAFLQSRLKKLYPHPYCGFSLRRQMAPQQSAKFRTACVLLLNFVAVWGRIASPIMDRFERSFLSLLEV